MKFRSVIASTILFLASGSPVFAAGPSIGTVSYPNNVTANIATTLSASVNSTAGIKSCNLYVDSTDTGAMNVNGSTASAPWTFTRGGVYTLFVFCRDNAGGMAAGANTSIYVLGEIVQTPSFGGGSSGSSGSQVPAQVPYIDVIEPTNPVSSTQPVAAIAPRAGSLIKLACADGAGSDDPCTAVYFVSADGKRRAFPNAKAYFTWYADFDAITTVSLDALSALPLGKNVTYRPGIRMVKFATLDRVYAVGSDGTLRWVTTEDVARTLYGNDWNTKVDDISDAFYTNYTFGTDISDAASFSPTTEAQSATTI